MNHPHLSIVGKRESAHGRINAAEQLPSLSIIGLGYVGAVSIGCLAKLGYRIVGVDIDEGKVRAIGEGRAPFVEAGLQDLLKNGVSRNLIRATTDITTAVLETDVTLLSVGTPTSPDGGCDLSFVRAASAAIGTGIANKSKYHVVVLRCSVPPGTTLDVVVPEIERASGKLLGRDFGVCFNPEFLREGVAVQDFYRPSRTVIGASDDRCGAIVREIFTDIDAPIMQTTIAAAEMVKYLDNVWHAAKIVFGNEAGRLCKSLDIDSHVVMNLFLADTKLNISATYLNPGFAFGGSCLPKEVRAVQHLAKTRNISLPLVDSLIQSNESQIEEAVRLLEPFKGKRIGILGLAFKPGTDDLRESPSLDLIRILRERGERVVAFDPNLPVEKIAQRANGHAPSKAEVERTELAKIVVADEASLLAESDVIVVVHATEQFRKLVKRRPPHIHVLDLARLEKVPPRDPNYTGIAW